MSITTTKKKWKTLRKRLVLGILAFLLLFAVIPYSIPLSYYDGHKLPYENSSHFEASGSSIHYRSYVPEQEPVKGKILLVHGMGGSTFSYEKNAPALASQGYYVVAVDLPGFGYSSRLVDENHAQSYRASSLWLLLDYLDANVFTQDEPMQQWHLAGHSMGGGTVAAMSRLNENRVASVVFIDGALFETNGGSSSLLSFPIVQRWVQVLLEHVIIKPKRFESFLRSAYGQPPEDFQIQGYYDPLSIGGTARSAPALIRTAKNIDESELTLIKIPALAIWGKNDTWVPLSEINRIQSYIPQLEISVINGAAHCPMETHPEEFNTRLLDWLSNF